MSTAPASGYLFAVICACIARNAASSTVIRSQHLNIWDVFDNCFEGHVRIPVNVPITTWKVTITFEKFVHNFQVDRAKTSERRRNGTGFVVGNFASDGYLKVGDDIYFHFQGFVDGIIPNVTIIQTESSFVTVLDSTKPAAKSDKELKRIIESPTRRCQDNRLYAAIKTHKSSRKVEATHRNPKTVIRPRQILKRSISGESPFLPVVPLEKNVEGGTSLKDDLGLVAASSTMLLWTSKWGVGGSGQIDLEKASHGLSGRSWIFKLLFPRGCYLSSAKFWHACIVESLTEPENGLFTFRQVGWQIYQDFIGILVTFQQRPRSVDCYKSKNYHIRFEDATAGVGMFPQSCTEEFDVIDLPESADLNGIRLARNERTKGNVRPVTTSTNPAVEISSLGATTRTTTLAPTEELSSATTTTSTIAAVTPNLQLLWLASTEQPINEERIARLQASVVPPTSVRLSWRRVQPRQRRITIGYTMIEEAEDRVNSQQKTRLWPTVTREISSRMTSLLIPELQPGRTYEFTAKVWDGSAYGPEAAVSATLGPSRIGEIRVTNPNSTSLRFQWIKPAGFQRSIIVFYYPMAANGFPKSPFTLPGTTTKTTITGLDKRQEYAVSFAVNNKDATSDARNVTAKTGNNLCGRRGCQRFAKCVQKNLTSECLCNFGYREDSVPRRNDQGSTRKVCKDFNECSGNNDCNENAICKNAPGSYLCQCTTGYEGDGKYCFDVDECSFTEIDVCPEATCRNTAGSYTCECEEGYVYKESSCQDIDECAAEGRACPENAECVNTDGSYDCECPEGRRYIENECQDIDECFENLHNCGKSQQCVNNRGGFSCLCPKGTRQADDGNTCTDVNECLERLDNCHAFASCKNANPSFSCTCNPGYVGNGVLCKDINECRQRHDCDSAGGECRNTPGSYTCICKQGFSGDGKECVSLS